jgi:hypothetical protein
MLTENEQEQIKSDYIQFMNHKINIPLNVKKLILIKAIMITKNKGNLPNAAYMRKVAESFIDEKAITLTKALEKMDRDKEFAMKQMRNNEPSWMDSYVDGLRAMEGNA